MTIEYKVEISNQEFCGFLAALLDDDNGISEKAWLLMCDVVERMFPKDPPLWWKTIKRSVEATDGRFYLPEGWAEDVTGARTPAELETLANLPDDDEEAEYDDEDEEVPCEGCGDPGCDGSCLEDEDDDEDA